MLWVRFTRVLKTSILLILGNIHYPSGELLFGGLMSGVNFCQPRNGFCRGVAVSAVQSCSPRCGVCNYACPCRLGWCRPPLMRSVVRTAVGRV